MATTKRAYKLQEFVAHSANVNCLKIGRRTSRVLVTGGEDHKVNLWAIGKPNAILSLSGHTSAIESVNFDSGEVLVAAGAASGTIKLWDLEEAKIVRTLTGHRSNCISVDFHPFGEFFASGSLDTNLKIWDIRRKGCIHTYKGHTRGVNAIRFTPDGRWVVSGGEDNTVKLWDLTAGKLLHDFKCHEGQVQCIDFHPHEFLLATGSADRTVKFWDLETFELIGSAGPETSGVRAMTFNPDGRTLLCGLHESLKVFSWEPVRCHDSVDVGWSRLSDLNIHEGKLLGCSYNQSCVGVWVVDVSRIEPYAVPSIGSSNSRPESKSTTNGNLTLQGENNIKVGMGRLSVSQNSEPVVKEAKPAASTGSAPGTPQRIGISPGPKVNTVNSASQSSSTTLKRSSSKSHGSANPQTFNKSDVVPVIVPRTNNPQTSIKSEVAPVIVPRTSSRAELTSESRRENAGGRTVPYNAQSKLTDFRKYSTMRTDSDRGSGFVGNNTISHEDLDQDFISPANGVSVNRLASAGDSSLDDARCVGSGKFGMSQLPEPSTSYNEENYNCRVYKPRHASSMDIPKGGRTRSLVTNWERKEPSPSFECMTSNSSLDTGPTPNISYMRGRPSSAEKETVSASDEGTITDLMEQHQQFINSVQSRLTKLQVVRRLWERKDVRGLISAMENMSDHAVSADVVSVLMEKSDVVTLDICTSLLPLLTSLLGSKMDRHLGISVEMLLKLVKIFGPVIHSTITAGPMVGVDLQAEQRLERCNICFIELEKMKHMLPSLIKRGGYLAKSTQELNLALQEVL
ncbi:katanin p80 WD40 repeat-containing subunit B1-like protein [Iris pallida]|uniref:Katanin p80 WD40 repeat-containing subunit B1 homolog n=1 Tax=Iris pallida TaxID=29817 RepID=A0AAX6DFP5_IRIPA|nr:katanin p80 WD40 repeat-containing subunit B1-like protein [Iris pallida]KAJ6837777.1 katanin p80 WD40 repeat-containing subunit B1-like protein [Iris pallida]